MPENGLQQFSLAIIDLDNTLYAADNGVFRRMDERMTSFMADFLSVPEAEANELRVRYWRQYGTTLRGLMLHHDMPPEAFLTYVHDIQAEEILYPSAALDAALSQMRCRKVIHTNGTREHAERITAALGVSHHFSAVYDIRFNNYLPKPCSNTLLKLLKEEKVHPNLALVIDDMEDNLEAAREIGAATCIITPEVTPEGTPNGLIVKAWNYQATSLPQLMRTEAG